MAKKAVSSKAGKPRGGNVTPLRFAQPFFTTTPVAARSVSSATNTRSMAAFAAQKLGRIPPPTRDPVIDLKDIRESPKSNMPVPSSFTPSAIPAGLEETLSRRSTCPTR